MPKRKSPTDATPAALPPIVPLILEPHAVFTTDQLRRALGLRASTLRREVRERRLKVFRRAK